MRTNTLPASGSAKHTWNKGIGRSGLYQFVENKRSFYLEGKKNLRNAFKIQSALWKREINTFPAKCNCFHLKIIRKESEKQLSQLYLTQLNNCIH